MLIEGYGLTETSPLTHANPVNAAEPGSIGLPLPDTDARIVDADAGTQVMPVGEIGELILRGPQVMRGYWRQPAATAAAIREGWFYTGDLAYMDGRGYFYIVDRKKDVINAAGFKVWPREVEGNPVSSSCRPGGRGAGRAGCLPGGNGQGGYRPERGA